MSENIYQFEADSFNEWNRDDNSNFAGGCGNSNDCIYQFSEEKTDEKGDNPRAEGKSNEKRNEVL